jgi:CubicO group peptidase (beta-lactamase class C family)
MKRLLAAILLLALVACEAGRDAANEAAAPRALQQGLVDPERIDATLRGFVERGELVGVSALVYEDGSEAYFGAFGMADRELDRRMQRDTLVQIFSMTKPLTGVTPMTLYEQGLFALDDPLHDYLPEFSGIRVYQGGDGDELRHAEPQRPPTIRDILRHTAGFANGERGDAPWVTRRYRETDPGRIQNTLQQMSERLASVPLAFEPGTRWSYGPSADVQARLVEVLSELPFQDMMHARVLTPLAMHDTQYTLSYEQLGRMSALYERKPDGSFERFGDDALNFNLYDWPMKPGSWGLTSTLDDYMRFARMLLNEGELDGIRILEPATVRLMSTRNPRRRRVRLPSWPPRSLPDK